ncbi:MAG TPA: GatB/YqeY domain-containing protein [Candidatus Paceibacterota bacterium]|nr:GatB/YqeY domain-containing protein [Candidatus Paceibacterota bacterium]HMP18721.1 GatB/YqeY domain-containing protein [Candidatus Paceibacterota bacterium]HMP85486.1 GatB/YqeY domain-containing protein [Candidatus Paceibacterota bacterium]
MTIQETIKEGIKTAMKSKDEIRLSVLRGLSASFTNELVNLKRTPQDKLSDEEALKVITRASKQRKDSIEQFEKGGRPELAESEKAELKIIEEFLPQLMSEEEIRAYVLAKKDEMGINSKEQFGQFMGAIMSGLKGKADGSIVKKVIEESL